MRRLLIRKYIDPLKAAFDSRVTTDGGTNEDNDVQIDTWINPWKSKILTLPNAFKAGVLYSIYGDDWDVVRAGATATRVKSDGEIQTGIDANVPRLDYLNGEPVVLVEGESENLLLRSEDFNNAYWTKQSATVSANAATAPDGTMTADLVYPSSSGALRGLRRSSSVDGRHSIYGKPSGKNVLTFMTVFGFTIASFDLSTGDFLQDTGVTATMDEMPNGWWRISVNYDSDFYLIVADTMALGNSTSRQVTANGTDGVLVWGAQLEEASEPSSYIPTVASTVTRNSDVIDVDVPSGTTSITVTFEDGSTEVENSPGATYQLPNGRIKSIQFL